MPTTEPAPAGRHAAQLDRGQYSTQADSWRLAAAQTRAQAGRDWVTRQLRILEG